MEVWRAHTERASERPTLRTPAAGDANALRPRERFRSAYNRQATPGFSEQKEKRRASPGDDLRVASSGGGEGGGRALKGFLPLVSHVCSRLYLA